MPVASFLFGASEWTLLDHKPQESARAGVAPRCVPVGVLHALDPEDLTTICSGVAMEPDPAGRTFEAWQPGTCSGCSAQLAPQPADVPPG